VSAIEQGGPVAAGVVRAKIDEVLARPEFHPYENPIAAGFGKVLKKILEAIGDLFGVGEKTAGNILLVVVYTGLAALVLFIVVSLVRRRRKIASASALVADPKVQRAMRVSDLRRRAREAELAGDLVLALRLYFTALVVALGERGDLDYRDAWTNRELLERGEPRPEVAALLRPLVPALDAKSFGHEPAEPEDVARMARLCDQILNAGAAGGAR
jgi:hypothetical protein